VEGLVWIIWGWSGMSTRGWCLAGVGVGGGELRDLGWAYIGTGGGMAAWARAAEEGPTRGQIWGRSYLAGASGGSPWRQRRLRQKNSRCSRRK
jgi:hypothetical protein